MENKLVLNKPDERAMPSANLADKPVPVELPVILFFALIMLMPIKAQTIEYKKILWTPLSMALI